MLRGELLPSGLLFITPRSVYFWGSRMKQCYKCKQEKPFSEFYQCKSGVNKGVFSSYCKKCTYLYVKGNRSGRRKRCNEQSLKHYYKKIKKQPWYIHLNYIRSRVSNKDKSYYKKGIKNFLNTEDIKLLWFRDKAYLLDKPSVDRKDNKGNYTLENCQFIELVKHREKHNREKIKTHCINGHEFSPDNTYVNFVSRRRQCKICRKKSKQKFNLRRKHGTNKVPKSNCKKL